MLGHTKTLREELTRRRYRYPLLAVVAVAAVAVAFFATSVPSVAAQAHARHLAETPAAEAGQKVLVFDPHPDDETIAVGGYIAQSIENGADVTIVLVTDGGRQQAARYSEFKTATSILGVPQTDLVFLGFPDGKLASQNVIDLQASLRAQLDSFQPNIVVYPHPRDHNPDHAALGRAVESLLASGPAGITAYEYIVHYELVYPRPYAWKFRPQLYLLPPNSLVNVDKEWLRFTLSTKIEDLKQEAILSYQSQFRSPELNGLLHSSVRRNELLGVPRP